MDADISTLVDSGLERLLCKRIKLQSLEECELLPFDVLGHVVQDAVDIITRHYPRTTSDAFFLKVKDLFVDKPFFMPFKLSANSVGHQFASHVQSCVGRNAIVDLTQPFALEVYRVIRGKL